MELALLIEVCSLYGRLGWAVQEQLDTLAFNENGITLETLQNGDFNPNALSLIVMFLGRLEGKVSEEVAEEANEAIEVIEEFLSKNRS